jgi:hypothetical protein
MKPQPLSRTKSVLLILLAVVVCTLAQTCFERQYDQRVSPEVQKAVDAKLNDTLIETVPDSMRNCPLGRAYDSAVKRRVAE